MLLMAISPSSAYQRQAGTQADHHHVLPEQRDTALPAVVAGIAVFEGVGALQAQPSGIVARRAKTADGHRIVKQLQILVGTGGTRFAHASLAGLETVVPKPGEQTQHQDGKRFEERHGRKYTRWMNEHPESRPELHPELHPYSTLTPDHVLDALEAAGLHPDGRLLALNSYENRVYQVGMEEGPPLIAKFYRPERWSNAAILEEHAFLAELGEAEIPVVPPLTFDTGGTLATHGVFRLAVFPRHGGRAPELGDPQTREWMGRFLGRIHAIGQLSDFSARPTLDIATFGEEPRDWLIAHQSLPPELFEAWKGTIDMALEGVRHAYDRAGKISLLRLHGDCHLGNVLWTDDGPHFVDFDDSRMGPAIQDLWMLLSGERMEMQLQLQDVIAGYEDFCEFDRRELHLIEALRTLRLIHYAAWIARRWEDPAFPAAFPWFGTAHYWQARILELKEQIAAMTEPPLII
ncbi:MAG: hypothetical protein QG616_876 [Pseudomonadota bacterium]|nr:hypothetical protein [Pseudomonadota bacterium]